MNHRTRSALVGVVSVLAVFVVAGVAKSAVTSFKGQGQFEVDSLKVGVQGSGGVTAFNGTIINNTTGANNSDQPVTFGDNVRIDGRVYRGATAGTTDTMPFIINDNTEIAGTLSVGGNSVKGTKRYSGTIDRTASGDFVATFSSGITCSDETATFPKYYHYHHREIAIPETTMAAPADVRVFTTPGDGTGYSPSQYPDSNNVWVSQGYSLSEGRVNLMYKVVTEACDGTLSTSYYLGTSYQILVK